MIIYPSFKEAISQITKDFKQLSKKIHTEKWQGIDVSKKPEAETHELFNYNFSVALGHTNLNDYASKIVPNLPWADDHFEERVCGEPINPGEQWKHWPWGLSADKFRDSNGRFNHNYMERYWPKQAGRFPNPAAHGPDRKGIRYTYGDLNDVVNLLCNEPNTRQAYMPVFFPEDTGAVHGGRIPCSLGYHFIHREGYLHINYYLRSCEVYRHFRDDCYLTVRLLLWVLDKLKEKNPEVWSNVKPGIYSMYITSFHCFVNDLKELKE